MNLQNPQHLMKVPTINNIPRQVLGEIKDAKINNGITTQSLKRTSFGNYNHIPIKTNMNRSFEAYNDFDDEETRLEFPETKNNQQTLLSQNTSGYISEGDMSFSSMEISNTSSVMDISLNESNSTVENDATKENIIENTDEDTLSNIETCKNVKESILESTECLKDIEEIIIVDHYKKDIWEYERNRERKLKLPFTFLRHQQGINFGCRSVLVEFMIEMSTNFGLSLQTLHTGVELMDRYTSKDEQCPRAIYQLVGMTALFISNKLHEVEAVYLKEFIEACDGAFNENDFFEMERKIFSKLSFNINNPTINFFADFIADSIKRGDIYYNILCMAMDVCLISDFLSSGNKVLSAAACIAYTNAVLNYPIWCDKLTQSTEINASQIKLKLMRLTKHIKLLKDDKDDNYIISKYKEYTRCNAGDYPVPLERVEEFVNNL
uniref:Cyclin N-terminal domain-containing protein n=1 Tax=Parastrongyloides trichosuri TaxID=131310 RepID=A0A0N4ZUQ3_PARTI